MGLELATDATYRAEIGRLQTELHRTNHELNTARDLLEIREDQLEVVERRKNLLLFILQALLIYVIACIAMFMSFGVWVQLSHGGQEIEGWEHVSALRYFLRTAFFLAIVYIAVLIK